MAMVVKYIPFFHILQFRLKSLMQDVECNYVVESTVSEHHPFKTHSEYRQKPGDFSNQMKKETQQENEQFDRFGTLCRTTS